LAKRRLDFFKKLPMAANPSVFDGVYFPKIDFVSRELVEEAFGTCSLHVRFFDQNWNEVTAPQAPGRYGALVEYKSEDGLIPAALGVLPETVSKEDFNISNSIGSMLEAAANRDERWAVLLAGLADIARDSGRWHGFTVWDVDRDWWAELGRRQGEDQDYPHLTRLPDGYDKDKRAWPLIVFLHGSGQRGNDVSQLKNEGPLDYINKGHPLPFIVVVPQCPENEWWDPVRLVRLIDQLEASNRVDSKRIYVTGLSMGGYGTFALAARYPDKIAAIAPMAGAASPENAERIRKVPTWMFHGSEDTIVPTRFSIDMAHALQKLNAPVKLTIQQGIGHGGWGEAYADPELYAWFLEHSK
jgi:predicted esterase